MRRTTIAGYAGEQGLAAGRRLPTLGYRFLTDELADVGIIASNDRVWRLCSTANVDVWRAVPPIHFAHLPTRPYRDRRPHEPDPRTH